MSNLACMALRHRLPLDINVDTFKSWLLF